MKYKRNYKAVSRLSKYLAPTNNEIMEQKLLHIYILYKDINVCETYHLLIKSKHGQW